MSKKITLRPHQEEARQRALAIARGDIQDHTSLFLVTPGGGKTIAYSVFAGTLAEARYINRVCLVTPRSSLSLQVAEAFHTPPFNRLLCRHSRENRAPFIRDAARGEIAYSTTYQAIVEQPELHLREFESGEWLIIFDELHHLGGVDENGRPSAKYKAWAKAVEPLVRRAKHVLGGSGTIARWDGELIPFIRYEPHPKEVGVTVPVSHVTYSRQQALRDKAILELNFKLVDADTTWRTDEKEYSVQLSTARQTEEATARKMALNPCLPFYNQVVDLAASDWLDYRARSGHNSQFLVICPDQTAAKTTATYIRQKYNQSTVLAISDESSAKDDLKRFRERLAGNVLVTVGMAYEGLDAPAISHMVCLTRIRSVPWLDQAFGRPARPDSAMPYESQIAKVFAPNDPAMRAAVEEVQRQQDEVRILRPKEGSPIGGSLTPGGPSTITPINALAGETTNMSSVTQISNDENRFIERIHANPEKYPFLKHAPHAELVRLLREELALAPTPGLNDPPPAPDAERTLSRECETLVRSIERKKELKHGTINGHIKRRFKKSRKDMSVSELREVLTYLKNYGDKVSSQSLEPELFDGELDALLNRASGVK